MEKMKSRRLAPFKMSFWILLFAPTVFLFLIGGAVEVTLKKKLPSKLEKIKELKENLKERAYPAFAAQELLVKEHPEMVFPDLLPLSGPSRTWTVFCREEGTEFLIYRSDRHGYHNPDSLWDLPQWEAVFLGDSFVQGACVPSEKNFVSLYGKDQGPTGNLGSYGNGPLSQLASLIEYGTSRKPKKIFWVYVSNDLGIDLNLESQSQRLMGYLKGQSQNLKQRQAFVDQRVGAYLEKTLTNQEASESWIQELKSYVTLRESLHFWKREQQRRRRTNPRPSTNVDFRQLQRIDWFLFRQVLQKAAEVSSSWGGKLNFVFLPTAEMLLEDSQAQVDTLKLQLQMITQSLNIDFIDVHQDFLREKSPLRFFNPLGDSYGHFNEMGYERTAQILLRK